MKNIEIVQTEYYDPFFFFPQSLDSKILQAVDVPMFKLASVTFQLHMLVCIFRWLGLQTYSCIQCPKALFECYVSDFTFDCTNIWKENNWFFFLKKKIDSYPYYFFCYYFKKKKKEWEGDTPFLFFFDPVKLQKQLYLQAAQVLTILCVKSEFSSLKYKWVLSKSTNVIGHICTQAMLQAFSKILEAGEWNCKTLEGSLVVLQLRFVQRVIYASTNGTGGEKLRD